MLFNKEQVLDFIPHRDPFLFVDSVEHVNVPGKEFEEGQEITSKDLIGAEILAHYRTRADHPIFAGHFPGNPILPGVVQVEMMAQSSIFILTKAYPNADQMNLEVALMSVESAKFRRPILPEMDLQIKASLTKVRGTFMTYDCEIHHNGELMSQASVLATVKLTPKE